MPALVVIGAQWGDEGKGKVVDYLTSRCHMAVRFQGGNNAGHTLVVNGVKTKLNLIPSGILREATVCLIGAGVVLNPEILLGEIEALRAAGVKIEPGRLLIDFNTQLILPYHIAIDAAREEAKGQNKIGTTGRGIGPAYEDRAARCGVRIADLKTLRDLKPRIEQNAEHANRYLEHVLGSTKRVDAGEVWQVVEQSAAQVLPYAADGSRVLHDALSGNQRIVFEGAQGTLLDQSFGTVPFVTSSHTLAGAVATGCGIGPRSIDYVLGVAKAYSTRVGSGPFPTELCDKVGDLIREKGAEFGTVTGRPRRCGWLDAVALRRAVRLNGLDSIMLTKLDVLSGLESLKICTGYDLDGQSLDDLPVTLAEISRLKPIYQQFKGWNEPIDQARKLEELPAGARAYIETLSGLIGCVVSMVSVSPERAATFEYQGSQFLREFVR